MRGNGCDLLSRGSCPRVCVSLCVCVWQAIASVLSSGEVTTPPSLIEATCDAEAMALAKTVLQYAALPSPVPTVIAVTDSDASCLLTRFVAWW